MPKINVYLPDDLADAVRDANLPVSAICQRALEDAVQRITVIRSTALDEIDTEQFAARLPMFTARAVTVLSTAVAAARATNAPNVNTGHLLRAMIDEGENLALRILRVMEIEPAALSWPDTDEPGGGPGLRYSTPAVNALALPVTEATAMGHNYIGCEHLIIGLAAEPDGIAGRVLRDAGADPKTVRRTVLAALGGYAHLRAKTAAPDVLTAVRAELAPLVARIERLESRLN